MKYTTIKKTKDDLESLVSQIKLSDNEEAIQLANEMSNYISAYTTLLNELDPDDSIHNISTVLGIRQTQILMFKIKAALFNNNLDSLGKHGSNLIDLIF
ncbi:MAG: hypothetical protein Q4B63_11820 [Clostridium perfringens]|nr:hypothetical protein [Clostridium perfringens]